MELDSFLPFSKTPRAPATAILTWMNGTFELLQPWVRLVPSALPGTLTSDSVGEAEVRAVIVAVK